MHHGEWTFTAKFPEKYLGRPSTANWFGVEAVNVGFNPTAVATGAAVLIPMTL